MSTGGFCFGKYVLNYAYGTGTVGETIRSWGLAVHKARCVAFMEAYNNEITNASGLGWSPIQTRGKESVVGAIYEITATSDGVSSSGQTYYIQDWASSGFDTNGEWPAFVSFFRYNGGSQEYCLITYRCMNCNPNWSDSTTNYAQGLYIHKNNLQSGDYGSGSHDHLFGESFMHAFAPNGFNNYNIQSSDFLSLGATKIFPSVFAGSSYDSNQSDYSSYLVGRRSNSNTDSGLLNRTFKFGYAVKQDMIELFFTSSSINNKWIWALIGNIFGNLTDSEDVYRAGCFASYYANGTDDLMQNDFGYYSYSYPWRSMCFCDKYGNQYDPKKDNGSSYDYWAPRLPLSYTTSSSAPTDIRYNAIPVVCFNNNVGSLSSDSGVDGNGNGFKGFLNTDCIRGISGNLCQNFGATLNNDKFITMYSGSSQYGFILGWDPSNESLYNS